MKKQTLREIIGFAIVPGAGLLLWSVIGLLWIGEPQVKLQEGLILAYTIAIVLGIPTYLIMKKLNKTKCKHFLYIGFFVASLPWFIVLGLPFIFTLISGESLQGSFWLFLFIMAWPLSIGFFGSVASWFFWLIAGRYVKK